MTGEVVSIHIASAAGAALVAVDEARLVAGRGIVGDRYYDGAGTFSPDPPDADHELTLISEEEIDAFNAGRDRPLGAGLLRRNIVVRGIDLNASVGSRLRVGAATLQSIRLCEPCSYLAGLAGPDILPALVHKAGLRAGILDGGTVRVGDRVELVSPGG